jgi:hypothetical protein
MLTLTPPLAAFYSSEALIDWSITLFEKKFHPDKSKEETQHYCAHATFNPSPFKSSLIVVAALVRW